MSGHTTVGLVYVKLNSWQDNFTQPNTKTPTFVSTPDIREAGQFDEKLATCAALQLWQQTKWGDMFSHTHTHMLLAAVMVIIEARKSSQEKLFKMDAALWKCQ